MIRKCFSLTLVFAICGLLTGNVNADLVYTSATFQNTFVTQDDALGYAITADVVEGGVTTGILTASLVYGGGTNPFNDGSAWGASSGAFRIFGSSTNNVAGFDTATGDWDLSVTALSGYQVDGITVFSEGAVLGNPDFTNIVSDGVSTIYDSTNLIGNVVDGQVIANGGSLLFNGGINSNGIESSNHARNWGINADASALSFTYSVGFDESVGNIAFEGLRLDVQTSAVSSIPEPSCFAMIGLGIAFIGMRRRR